MLDWAWPSSLPDVSRETLEDLQAFASLLEKWTKRINLVAPSTVSDLWRRHIIDSCQLYTLVDAHEGTWFDLGSGGGLPALPCAVLAKHEARSIDFHLVESDKRKAAFLHTAIRSHQVSASMHAIRAESLTDRAATIITARALAPLPRLLALAHQNWTDGTVAIFPKGQSAQTEIERARQDWHFTLEVVESITDPRAALLKIGDLRRV
ncbi:MAG: 16S rRNA (guanine(527)-N(7))-methyltransferase RsmG [Pseudomonadota bacterium]